jgi:murein DD-endopeptidase MepM/ murein hydrolase activator NlpD
MARQPISHAFAAKPRPYARARQERLRIIAFACLLAGIACVQPRTPSRVSVPADVAYLRERRIMVPVHGFAVERVPDHFRAKRGGRLHNAVDLMAPKGTPVLAADDGRVFKLAENEAGGLTIYATDPNERIIYYYAHLDRYRRGLDQGDRIRKGEVIGYVGHSGNARKEAPHLHFQIMRLDDVRRWWAGSPIDPKPVLALDGVKK